MARITFFDLEDGCGIVEAANRNDIDRSLASKILKKHGLSEKYTKNPIYDEEIREQARQLRQQGKTVRAIAQELGVAKSSVHLWCQQVSKSLVPELADLE